MSVVQESEKSIELEFVSKIETGEISVNIIEFYQGSNFIMRESFRAIFEKVTEKGKFAVVKRKNKMINQYKSKFLNNSRTIKDQLQENFININNESGKREVRVRLAILASQIQKFSKKIFDSDSKYISINIGWIRIGYLKYVILSVIYDISEDKYHFFGEEYFGSNLVCAELFWTYNELKK